MTGGTDGSPDLPDPRAVPASDPWSTEAHTFAAGASGASADGWSPGTWPGAPTSGAPTSGAPTSEPPVSGYPPTASFPTASGYPTAPGHPATSGYPATASYPQTAAHPETAARPETAAHPETAAYPETPGYAASSGYPAAPPAAPPYASAPPYPPAPPYAATPFVGPGQRTRRRSGRWAATAAFLAVLLVGGALLIPKLLPGQDGQQGLPGTTGEPRITRGPVPGAGPVETPGAALTEPSGDAGASPAQYDPNPPGSGPRPARSPATPGAYPAGDATPGTEATAGVVYELKVSGNGNLGRVRYQDKDGESITLAGIELPWRLAFVPTGGILSMDVQRFGGDPGPMTCTITVDGKLRSSMTQKGRKAHVHCVTIL